LVEVCPKNNLKDSDIDEIGWNKRRLLWYNDTRMKEAKRTKIQVRIDKQLDKAIRHRAVDLERTITQIVEEALREWLERHKENNIAVD